MRIHVRLYRVRERRNDGASEICGIVFFFSVSLSAEESKADVRADG